MGGFGPGNLSAGVLEGALHNTANAFVFNVVREVGRAVRNQSVAGLGAGTAAMTALVSDQVTDERKRDLANRAIGRDVRDAIVDGYDRKVAATKNRNPLYANRKNRLTGKLRPALANPSLYRAGPRQMQFLNTAQLTSQARHWARLNFGVEGWEVSGQQSPDVMFTLFGQQYSIGLREGLRPGYSLPLGSWTDPSGTSKRYNRSRRGIDMYQPHSRSLRNRLVARGMRESPIAGIEPRYFIEDGLREFPRSFRRQYNRLIDEALDGADGAKVQNAVRKAVAQAANGNVNFHNIRARVTD